MNDGTASLSAQIHRIIYRMPFEFSHEMLMSLGWLCSPVDGHNQEEGQSNQERGYELMYQCEYPDGHFDINGDFEEPMKSHIIATYRGSSEEEMRRRVYDALYAGTFGDLVPYDEPMYRMARPSNWDELSREEQFQRMYEWMEGCGKMGVPDRDEEDEKSCCDKCYVVLEDCEIIRSAVDSSPYCKRCWNRTIRFRDGENPTELLGDVGEPEPCSCDGRICNA